MARPKSPEKRDALLAAAIELIAEQGLSVPTSKIAQVAGVAEGTLFTYFETRERLLNELYLVLKRGEREEMMRDYPFEASLEERARHFWNTYIALGVNHPDKYKVMLLLRVSDHINEQVKRLGREGYEALGYCQLIERVEELAKERLTGRAKAARSQIARYEARLQAIRTAITRGNGWIETFYVYKDGFKPEIYKLAYALYWEQEKGTPVPEEVLRAVHPEIAQALRDHQPIPLRLKEEATTETSYGPTSRCEAAG